MQAPDKLRPELLELLSKPVRELGLKVEGSPIEPCVEQLYRELEKKKLMKFRPPVYLTDEWGCPSGEPVIGLPFYLANPDLAQLEREMNDLEDAREIMMYLRHEAGHAFNYAYRLYNRPEWKHIFGWFRRPYRENYRPVPFSRNYVRHMAGWYAQKHPDEDFAETFAVWLTPRSGWRKRYRGWGAMAKLQYMDRIARELSNVDPVRKKGTPDITVAEMEITVAEFYHHSGDSTPLPEDNLDNDLATIFRTPKTKRTSEPAELFLRRHRKTLVDQIAIWTAMQRPRVRKLMETIEKRSAEMGLRIDRNKEAEQLSEFTVFATTLVMNHLARSK